MPLNDPHAIPKENYYDRQLLTVEDFTRERDFHIAHRELQTRLLFTPGCLMGLNVQPGTVPSQVQVTPGIAFDGSGQQIILVDSATLNNASLALQSGAFVIDLNNSSYYTIGQQRSWLLTIAYQEQTDPNSPNQLKQVPLLSLVDAAASAPNAAQIPLAKLAVQATQQAPVAPAKVGVITVQVQVDTSARVNLELDGSRLPNISADKITGQLKPGQIPPPPPSPILDWVAQLQKVLSLDAANNIGIGVSPTDAKLEVSGILRASQIQGAGAGITNLKASNIEGGLSLAQIPDLPSSKIIGLLETLWAQDVAIYAQGLKLAGLPQASSGGGFLIGLLKTQTNQGNTYFALGIGFQNRLLTFSSQQLATSALKLNVYPERARYDLGNEGGAKDEVATSVTFVGVEADYAFNLLQPESELPATSKNKIRSLVTFGTSAVDAADIPSQIAANVINRFRDAVSPFSFIAVANPAAPVSITPEEVAQQLSSAGVIAPEAAAIIVAQQPAVYIDQTAQLIQLMAGKFQASTKTPAQMAWTLAAAGIPAEKANAALGVYYRGQIKPKEFLSMTLGAFPVPDVQKVVAALQETKSAQEAALQLKQANPQFDKLPVQFGILLRLNFSDSADTPLKLAQALNNAGYTLKADVQSALALLFPNAKAADISAAVDQFWKT